MSPHRYPCSNRIFPVVGLTFLVLLLLTLLPSCSFAGGIFHVFPPTLQGESFAVARPEVLVSKALITVSEADIESRFDQTFFNNNEFPLKGIFLLPIEEDAQPGSIDVRINGAAQNFTVVTGEAFFPTLRDMTVTMQDPSLLGLAGKRLLMIRDLTVGARQQIAIRVHYKRPLLIARDELELVVPLDGERYALGPVGEFKVMVRFKMSRRVAGVFSPSHHIATVRESPRRCMVWSGMDRGIVRNDFSLLVTFGSEDLDFRIFTYRRPEQKGTFMAMVIPPLPAPEGRAPAKDVVFVVDISGAQQSGDAEFARRVVAEGISRLGARDRFNVLAVGTRVRSMAQRLRPVTEDTVAGAVQYLGSLGSSGGADMYNAVLDALGQFSSSRRLRFIVFVGRGRPTVGITRPEAILEAIHRDNKARARIFALGVGEQADIALLDRMATTNRGGFSHAKDAEHSGPLAEDFLSRVSPPLVADLSFQFHDLAVESMDPDPIPDIFSPEGRNILGRYSGDSDVTSRVRLKARAQGPAKTVARTVMFPLKDDRYPFLPGLWAMRETASLLERELLKGPESGARGKVIKLAEEFGFKIPSALLSDTPRYASVDLEFASLLWQFKTSNVISDVTAETVRIIGSKVFRFGKNGWVDTEDQGQLPTRTVAFLSDEYFDLVRNRHQLGRFFALGPHLALVWDKELLRITGGR